MILGALTLTLHMAAMHPDVICGAVPINGALFVDNPDLAGLAFMPGAPAAVPGVTELAYEDVPVPSIRQIYALMSVTRKLLPRVKCPTLVIQSREDHVVVPENAPFIIENVGSEDKRLLWLENSYHVATLNHDRELIARETLKFIRSHLS